MVTFLEPCKKGGIYKCERGATYKCDNCGKTFKGKEVKLEEVPANMRISAPVYQPILIDRNNVVRRSSIKAKEGNRILVCPYCNEPHLFGFDRA